MHSGLELHLGVPKIHSSIPTPVFSPYQEEHYDPFSAKSTEPLGIYESFMFCNWSSQKYQQIWQYGISFVRYKITTTGRKKLNTTKVANILVYSHYKNKNKDMSLCAQKYFFIPKQEGNVSLRTVTWYRLSSVPHENIRASQLLFSSVEVTC